MVVNIIKKYIGMDNANGDVLINGGVNMKLPKLENGMFGEMNDGSIFVVVNDLIVYQNGCFGELFDFNNDDLSVEYAEDWSIAKLTKKAKSFNHYKYLKDDDFLFDRSKLPKRMTIDEIEKALGYKIKIVGDKEND